MVHICSPYSPDKNLGKVYNQTMKLIPDGDWCCLTDYDFLFLTPDCGMILTEYTKKYPDTGIFTCYTNRIHPNAKDQLLDGVMSENTDITYHMERAYHQKRFLFEATEIDHMISGFLMMISKETWKKIKFSETGLCLGVDNDFSQKVLDAGLKIRRMESLYGFHLYRLRNGITDKTHLR